MVKSGREEGFLYNILYLTAEIRSTKQLIFIKNNNWENYDEKIIKKKNHLCLV